MFSHGKHDEITEATRIFYARFIGKADFSIKFECRRVCTIDDPNNLIHVQLHKCVSEECTQPLFCHSAARLTRHMNLY